MHSQALKSGHETGRRGQIQRLLNAANSNIRRKVGLKPAADVKPGPFDLADRQEGSHPAHALITGLLVIYPVVASVAVVLAGFWFLDGSGPV